MQSQRVGFVILVVSILLFIEAMDRMDWWDQADKEYERECLPNNNPQPDTELCTELQNEANRRDYAKEELYTLWQRVQGLQLYKGGSGGSGSVGEREQFEAIWREWASGTSTN